MRRDSSPYARGGKAGGLVNQEMRALVVAVVGNQEAGGYRGWSNRVVRVECFKQSCSLCH